jgi:hypothetical protein
MERISCSASRSSSRNGRSKRRSVIIGASTKNIPAMVSHALPVRNGGHLTAPATSRCGPARPGHATRRLRSGGLVVVVLDVEGQLIEHLCDEPLASAVLGRTRPCRCSAISRVGGTGAKTCRGPRTRNFSCPLARREGFHSMRRSCILLRRRIALNAEPASAHAAENARTVLTCLVTRVESSRTWPLQRCCGSSESSGRWQAQLCAVSGPGCVARCRAGRPGHCRCR